MSNTVCLLFLELVLKKHCKNEELAILVWKAENQPELKRTKK